MRNITPEKIIIMEFTESEMRDLRALMSIVMTFGTPNENRIANEFLAATET